MDSQADLEREDDGTGNSIGVFEIIGFVLHSARRHARLGIVVAVVVATVGVTIAQYLPMKYEASSRILVDETAAKTEALSTPDRVLPNLDPISGVLELLLQQSHLKSMVDESGLLANWEAGRSTPQRAKDRVIAWISGGPTSKEKREALTKMLSNNISSSRDKDTVTIRVIWTDPTAAFRVAKIAQRDLIELVRARETASYSSVISILEKETKHAAEAIEPALSEVAKARMEAAKGAGGPATTSVATTVSVTRRRQIPVGTAPATVVAPASSLAGSVSAQLLEIGSKMQAVEEPWRRRQQELKSRLAELTAVYGQAHPEVVQQENRIKAASVPPAELVELKNARTDLLNRIQSAPEANPYEDRAVAEVPSQGTAPGVSEVLRAGAVRSRSSAVLGRSARREGDELDEDPAVTAAMAGLNRAIDSYSRISGRLASTRLQFTAAQVAFDARFVVTGEPEVPRKPLKPLRAIMSIASLVAAMVFGLLVGGLRDLASGKVFEPWQVKPIGLRVLGQVSVPKHLEK